MCPVSNLITGKPWLVEKQNDRKDRFLFSFNNSHRFLISADYTAATTIAVFCFSYLAYFLAKAFLSLSKQKLSPPFPICDVCFFAVGVARWRVSRYTLA